jgi:hypothetical protein
VHLVGFHYREYQDARSAKHKTCDSYCFSTDNSGYANALQLLRILVYCGSCYYTLPFLRSSLSVIFYSSLYLLVTPTHGSDDSAKGLQQKEWRERGGLDSSSSGKGPMACLCEHGTETSGCTKDAGSVLAEASTACRQNSEGKIPYAYNNSVTNLKQFHFHKHFIVS